MHPCEYCKQHIVEGDWYWGRSYSRWCFDCAPGVATSEPPEPTYALARWSSQRGQYLVTLRSWAGGPLSPPCDRPCREYAGDFSDCPFQTCPMK